MTAENQNKESSSERPDQHNLSVQGSVDKSTIAVGDRNVINQGPSYHTTNVLGSLNTEQLQLKQLRKPLLKQMKTDVAQRLEDSLHNLIRVDLEQEEQRYQVGRRRKEPLVEVIPQATQTSYELIQRKLAVSRNNEARELIPPAEQTYNIFHRSDIGGRLLILGEPGAGKTTELLMVAQRLVDAAIEDNEQPIPLIFELSSWESKTPILTWLGQQLHKSYGVSKQLAEPLATRWIQQIQILPLLDGLDELGQSNQVACINALEGFLAQHPALSVLICCRREEYEQGGEQLNQLNGAIYLQAIGLPQIQQYLNDLGREQLWEGIQATPELLKLAQSPLFLTMLVIAHQGKPIQDKSSLFNAYIRKQLHEPSHQGAYKPGTAKSPAQTLYYLSWLARQLKKRQETEFLIENLQPNWLASKKQNRTYKLIVGLIFGLIFGLIVGLLGGLISGLISGLMFGLISGLMFGLFGGLLSGFMIGLSRSLDKIEPQEQLRWSLRQGLISGLSGGLVLGLLVGLSGGVSGMLLFGLSSRLSGGLLVGLLFGLSGGVSGGLINKAIEQKTVSNQGIKKSIQNGLIGGLSSGLIGGLLFGLIGGLSNGLIGGLSGGLIGGLCVGLSVGLRGGLKSAIQHFSLRICLTKNRSTPWNYAQFLEHVTRHRFIQRTGGRYRFVHDLLRQHFAQMTPEEQALLAQLTSSNRQ